MLLAFAIIFQPTANALNSQESKHLRPDQIGFPTLSEDQKKQVASLALSLPELKKWSNGDWRVASIGTLGVIEPKPRITHAIVDLVLPKDADAPKECSSGWGAQIKINIDTMKVEEKSIPSVDHAVCGVEMGSPIQAAP